MAVAKTSRTSLLAAAAVLAAGLSGAGRAADAEGDGSFWTRGRLDLRYIFRAEEGTDQDQDLIQDLFIEGGRASSFRFEASGRVREDIDGQRRGTVFRDVHDTFGDSAHAYLYTAYAELLDAGTLARARLGRQYYGEGVELRFDGGLVETKALAQAVKLVAYGGVPVHFYEASATGDWLAGGAVELVAIPQTTVRFDYAHVTDVRDDLEDALGDRDTLRDDDYFQLAIAHRLTETVRLRGEASTFEGKSSRFSIEGLYLDRDLDLQARARYLLQVGAYRDLSIQFTPLDEVLGKYEPYHELLLDARKGMGDHLSFTAGVARRELDNEHDEGPFNHEFTRVFASADLVELPWDGFGATVLGEWYGSDSDEETWQVSGDLSQKLGDVTLGAGTSYARYRFDEFFLEERENVRTYFGTLEWRAAKWIRPRLGYEFTDDDEERYHVARCDIRLSF